MTTTAAEITAERRARQQSTAVDLKGIIEAKDQIAELLGRTQRRLDCYEFSDEILEFVTNPHQFSLDEGLTDDEVSDLWGEVGTSLQLTPGWCLTARIEFTLSLGDRLETFRQLLPRLSGMHQQKLKTLAIASSPRDQIDKYLDLAEF